jgi:hypothetical protein
MATTYTAEILSHMGRVQPFPLDGAFSLAVGPTADPTDPAYVPQVFTGLPLDLFLTNATTGARLTLTDADATLSAGGTVVTFAKGKAWAANLAEGEYDALLYVNDAFYLHLSFLAFVPTGGRVSP